MKKIMPFIVFLCCFGTVLHAQLDTFNLSRYKLPDIKFRQLDLNVHLDGSHTFNNSKTEDNSSSSSTFASLNDLSIGYRSYKNSEHLQNEQEFTLGLSPDFNNSKSGNLTDKNTNFTGNIRLNSQNRIYYQNQFFFEPDIQIYGNVAFGKEDNESELTLKTSALVTTAIQVPLLVGHGRIEQVQDARLAIYIFQELQKAGRISQIPNDEEILEFSKLISRLKNERYFDYRLRKMEEIEKVDSFLQTKGLITKPDARYFAIVNDNWDYAQGPVRESGKRLSAGLVPDFAYLNSNEETSYSNPSDTSKQKFTRNSLGIKIQAVYKIEKPINLHWQKSMSVNLSYGYSKNLFSSQFSENPEIKSDADQLQLDAGINYGMGYFPNSRTDISGVASLDFQQSNRQENLQVPLDQIKGYGLAPKISLVLHYYISPQCRLNINYNISYYYSNSNLKYDYDTEFYYTKLNYLNQSFSVGFLYSFF